MKPCYTAVLFLALVTSAHGATGEDVEAVERARFDALTKQDLAKVESMLADDLVYCHSNGRCDTKKSFIDGIRSGATVYRQIDVKELKVRMLKDTAIINGSVAVKVEASGKPVDLALVYTDVYVLHNGKWLLASYQSTRLP